MHQKKKEHYGSMKLVRSESNLWKPQYVWLRSWMESLYAFFFFSLVAFFTFQNKTPDFLICSIRHKTDKHWTNNTQQTVCSGALHSGVSQFLLLLLLLHVLLLHTISYWYTAGRWGSSISPPDRVVLEGLGRPSQTDSCSCCCIDSSAGRPSKLSLFSSAVCRVVWHVTPALTQWPCSRSEEGHTPKPVD